MLKQDHPATNDDSPGQCPPLADVETEQAAFLAAYPDYAATRAIDDLRASEFSRLDQQKHVYLDYTGGSQYADRQLEAHMALLKTHVLGNPHSINPTSHAATELTEQVRAAVLAFFNASPDEYEVVFTANASGALKLVGESYPFGDNGQYLLTYDNHNSVNGIREFARRKGAPIHYLPLEAPELRVNPARLREALGRAIAGGNNLFAFPAQSNFSGVQHPLEWVAQAQAAGWDVLLDAAAFTPTNRLDLSVVQPDYVDLSFYKLFGYPTGVGALIAKKAALAKLQRPWFAGGTVRWASVNTDEYVFAGGAAMFEEGTVSYLTLPAVEIGLNLLREVGIDTIHTRVMALTDWLLRQLTALRHSNGRPLVQVYGPTDTTMRGGTVALNLMDAHGQIVNHFVISHYANEALISLRTGAFCNPGTGELALQLASDDHLECPKEDEATLRSDFNLVLDPRNMGALRVSLGLVSNFADVYAFVAFVRRWLG